MVQSRESNLSYIIGPMRPPFLLLAVSCTFAGIAAGIFSGGRVTFLNCILLLLGGLATHIAVNALNEFFDIKSGLDLRTQRTPFSGGSGALAKNPAKAPYALGTAIVSGLAVVGIGLYFCFASGWGLLPLGLLGLIVIIVYTPWLNHLPVLCLLAPGLGFGTLIVMGSAYALGGGYTWTAFFVSLVPFFLVNNLLLLNQFPDVEADRSVGRRHLVIAAGKITAARVYVLFLACAYLSVLAGVLCGFLPPFAFLACLTLPLAAKLSRDVLLNAEKSIDHLIPSLGMNVILNLLTPFLLGMGLLIG